MGLAWNGAGGYKNEHFYTKPQQNNSAWVRQVVKCNRLKNIAISINFYDWPSIIRLKIA